MILLALMACDPEPECSEQVACEFGSVCVEGVCQEIPCATSAQCGMEQYCDDRTCTDGCLEDSDCYPGYECNTEVRECVDAACRDTQLDCGFGEFCNGASGDCYDAGGYYCRSCADDSDCGGGGNMCVSIGGDTVCGVECTDDSECPAGYGCLGIRESLTGPVISYQCLTYCFLGEEEDDWSKEAPALRVPDLSLLNPVLPECDTESL